MTHLQKNICRKNIILFLAKLLTQLSFIFSIFSCSHNTDWRKADRSSMGIAPTPEQESEAIVHVYAARAVRWRGYFAVHSWVATKEKNADHYTTYHVVGFRVESRGTAVVVEKDIPDRRWYGAAPDLIQELKGEKAEAAIPKIKAAVENYPNASTYRVWPGPNSNTFVSYILRNVPELTVELPPHAIGKDWLNDGDFFAYTESGSGLQFSFFGLLGLSLGAAEGIEVNLLGLNFGIDVLRPALKLPLLGRVGFKDKPVWD